MTVNPPSVIALWALLVIITVFMIVKEITIAKRKRQSDYEETILYTQRDK